MEDAISKNELEELETRFYELEDNCDVADFAWTNIPKLLKEITHLRTDIKEVLNHQLDNGVRVWATVAVVNPDLIQRLMMDEE